MGNRRKKATAKDIAAATILTEIQARAAVATAKPLSEQQMVETLQDAGYTIRKEPPKSDTVHSIKGQYERYKDLETLRFGAFSCAHLGSQYQQRKWLHTFYQRCWDSGARVMLCAGDIFDGDGKVYKGHEYEVLRHGYKTQLDYGVENFPHIPGMQTYTIAGNHDLSFWERGGADIVAGLAEQRKDITYLGHYGASVEFDGFKVYLMHGKGGATRGQTYRIQQIIEGFAPEQKPHLLLLGHFHTFGHLPMYRNVIGWQLGCFQAQTPFEKRLGLYPQIGGLILEISRNNADQKGGIVEIGTKLPPFYKPIDKDW